MEKIMQEKGELSTTNRPNECRRLAGVELDLNGHLHSQISIPSIQIHTFHSQLRTQSVVLKGTTKIPGVLDGC